MATNLSSLHSGLFCIAVISRMNGAPLEMEQLQHQFGSQTVQLTPLELARYFKESGINATLVQKDIADLKKEFFPVVAMLDSGDYIVLARKNDEKRSLLVQESTRQRAQWVPLDKIQPRLTDTFILLKKKVNQDERTEHFGLKWFFLAAAKYWTILRDCIFASMFVQIFALLSPLVFMIVIDKVLSNNSLSTLDVLVLALIVASAFEILLNGVRAYLLSHTANRIDLMLGVRLFKHLLSLPLSYFESRQVGDTIARMRELENVRQFITGSGLMLILDLFFLVVFITVMFLFSPFLSMLVVIALPFLFCTSLVITPFLRDRLEDQYAGNAGNQSFLVETISGIETIKATAAEPRIRTKWETRLARHVKNGFKSGHLANLINQSTTVISKILSVLLLWFGAREVLQGNLTVGQLIAFNMLSSRVIAPIIRLAQIWKEFEQVKISVARIGDIFSCTAEPGFDPNRVSLPSIRGDVVFDRVSFKYHPERNEVLSDISFSVTAGEVVGIVGSTGSGKTTLVKLLQRLYVPERGRILLDGTDLCLADSSWLRRQMGVVLQDGVLFNMSIRDNIALNAPHLEIEKIIEAAKLSGAHPFIRELPEGYDTLIGERGLLLSTGQRQRLAIARALATDPAMLILDEATSSLDYESELLIQQNMKNICKGRTVFIIAHRLSTVRHADRIITLENGRIVENGPPEQLLSTDGRYALLHGIQEGSYA
ncbi:peptidase C39 [Desulfomarina profundi]|uniref:Peptidase C39 n=1 Tax=Desulfomarina profundi TaxID=2772557 RepID=A0A8D5FRI1_9BACT|nr:type I secretion system permease/ATPase [Desulfomarina profundi]BCL62385.1 peptidase C39 [Desulfomarina profundi]